MPDRVPQAPDCPHRSLIERHTARGGARVRENVCEPDLPHTGGGLGAAKGGVGGQVQKNVFQPAPRRYRSRVDTSVTESRTALHPRRDAEKWLRRWSHVRWTAPVDDAAFRIRGHRYAWRL